MQARPPGHEQPPCTRAGPGTKCDKSVSGAGGRTCHRNEDHLALHPVGSQDSGLLGAARDTQSQAHPPGGVWGAGPRFSDRIRGLPRCPGPHPGPRAVLGQDSRRCALPEAPLSVALREALFPLTITSCQSLGHGTTGRGGGGPGGDGGGRPSPASGDGPSCCRRSS